MRMRASYFLLLTDLVRRVAQDLHGVDERDANLWKAYFRANAEYITR